MKRKKRMIAMAAAAALLIGLSATALTSCKPGAGGEKDGDIVIDWYMMNPISVMGTEDVKMVTDKANEIIYPATGAKLAFHFYDRTTYNQRMQVMLSTGEEIDIMFLSGTGEFDNEALLDISGMLKEHAPDILAKTDELMWRAATVKGAIRAIPGQNTWARPWGWVLKKDLVEKYNFDYTKVSDYKDLEPFLEAVKKGEPNMTPILMAKSGYMQAPGQQTWCNQIAQSIVYDTDAKKFVRQLVENEETIDRYRLMWEWYQKGYIAQDALALDSYQSEAKTGRYAVVNNNGKYDETFVTSTSFYGYDTVECFIGFTKNVDANSVAVVSNGIGATCPHPEKALEVLNLIWKDTDLSNLLAYGIEDVHYTINKERSAEIGSKSVLPKSGNEATYTVFHNWLGPLWDQWDSTWNTVEAIEEYKQNNEKAKSAGSIPECFGFTFDNSEYKTEMAAVGAVMSAAKPILETGSAENFDTYLKELNDKLTRAGIDTLVEAVNRQYNEWLAENKKK